MREYKRPITSTEAKRSLKALDILSGKAENSDAAIMSHHKKEQHESKIQQKLFEWANLTAGRYPELRLMFHIANGGRRDIIEAAHLKQQGVKAGVPDICLPVPRSGCHGLYIELKAEGGRLQDTQRTWLDDLSKQGYKTVIAYGFDEARQAIENYLKGESI